MGQFVMNGKNITGYSSFRAHFAPGELLRQRELAAGFLFMHFHCIDTICMYHAEMFYLYTFADQETLALLSLQSCEKYGRNDVILCGLEKPAAIRKKLLEQYFHEPAQKQRMHQLWQLAMAAPNLSKEEKTRLYCLLMAGYSLADKSLADCPITAEEAENYFLRREKTEYSDAWLRFDPIGDILLEARKQPYRILMKQGARERLQAGDTIVQRKFVAMPDGQKTGNASVILHLYEDERTSEFREWIIPVGDYCYANFVGTVPVYFHETVRESDFCRLERIGKKVIYTLKATGQQTPLYNADFTPVGFVPEQTDAGWLLLWEGGVDMDFYSRKMEFGSRAGIVEACFRGEECLLLDGHGKVHSNISKICAENCILLDEFEG